LNRGRQHGGAVELYPAGYEIRSRFGLIDFLACPSVGSVAATTASRFFVSGRPGGFAVGAGKVWHATFAMSPLAANNAGMCEKPGISTRAWCDHWLK